MLKLKKLTRSSTRRIFVLYFFLGFRGPALPSIFFPISQFESFTIYNIFPKWNLQGVSKKADKNLYKIKSSITSPVFDLTGLLYHGNFLIVQKMSNSWDSLAHFLQEKPITYVIKSDMNFKDFILYQNLSVFFRHPV